MKGNAQIESTMLGFEDHGILTCFLNLRQEHSGQSFGGYALGGPYMSFWVEKILEVVGVEKWEDLDNKYIRVKGEEFGKIEAIGHITDDKWFYPKKDKPKQGE